MEETKNIRVILIFEIIGRPPKHLVDSLGKIIKEVDKEKGVTVISKNIKDPSELKDKKGFYTTFAEDFISCYFNVQIHARSHRNCLSRTNCTYK